MRYFILFLTALILSHASQAAEPVPGNACSTAGATMASNNSGIGHFMVCQGGTWKSVYSYSAAGAITKIGNLSCATNEILKFNGTSWACAADGGAADNLGNHTATQPLDMAGYRIDNLGNLSISHPGSIGIEMGEGATADRRVLLDMTGDTTYTDYGLRIMRDSGGANTPNYIMTRGTGGLFIKTLEAAPISFSTDGTTRLTIDSSGNIQATGNMQAATFSGSGTSMTNLNASNLASGTVATARLGSGTANNSTYLRGDGSWVVPPVAAAGANGEVQFNSGGNLGSSSNLTYSSTSGLRISGNATSGTIYSLQGIMSITGGTAYGLSAIGSSTSGTVYGVYGNASTTSGAAYGVYGTASNTGGTSYGIYAKSSMVPSTTYALYCDSGSANGCGGSKAWYNASDGRLKKDVTDLPSGKGLSAIMSLRPVTYRWRNGGEQTEMGFIAQEVEGVFPELVGRGPDTVIKNTDGTEEKIMDVRSLSYASFVVPLVRAVQELQEENKRLAARIKQLENTRP